MTNEVLMSKISEVKDISNRMGDIDDYADMMLEMLEDDFPDVSEFRAFAKVCLKLIKRRNRSASVWIIADHIIKEIKKEEENHDDSDNTVG